MAGSAQGQNIWDEGLSFSGGRTPQSRRLNAGMEIAHYIECFYHIGD